MEFAEENYAYFVGKVGATEIATKEALRLIQAWINASQAQSILEIGSGIGTITRLICMSANPDTKILAYEKNQWCRDRFQENFDFKNVEIFQELSGLLNNRTVNVDLCIIDDFLNDSETNQLIRKFNPKIVFIEGHRRIQQLFFAKALHDSGVNFKYRNHSKTDDSYKAGVSFVTSRYSNYLVYSGLSNYTLVLFRIRCGLFYSKLIEIRSRVSLRGMLNRFK
jgi:precorrin-6B methylase 2